MLALQSCACMCLSVLQRSARPRRKQARPHTAQAHDMRRGEGSQMCRRYKTLAQPLPQSHSPTTSFPSPPLPFPPPRSNVLAMSNAYQHLSTNTHTLSIHGCARTKHTVLGDSRSVLCCWVMDQDASGTEDAAKKWVETSNLARSVAAIFNIDPYAVTPFPPEPLRVANASSPCAQAHLLCARWAGLLHLGSQEGAAGDGARSRATRRSRPAARGRSLGCFACHAGVGLGFLLEARAAWLCGGAVAPCVSAGW